MRLLLASTLLLVPACSSEHRDESRPLDASHQDARCSEGARFDEREPHHSILRSACVISSESIAKDVAYSYLKAVYPNDRHLRPMEASLNKGVWTVNG